MDGGPGKRRVAAVAQNEAPRRGPGRTAGGEEVRLQPVEDLVGPEPLEPVQRFVEGRELVGADTADLLDSADVLLVERLDDVAHLAALIGQPNAHRPAIDARALVVEEAHLD